jgi:hypothetical protein
LIGETGFPNQIFNDSWVVGCWRADYGGHEVELGRRAWALAKRIGEKKHTDDGYEAVFQISQAFVHDAKGDKVDDVPQSLFWAILSVVQDHDEVQDDTIVQSFLASGSLTRAQLVLRTAAGFSLKEGERIHWKEVGRDFDSVLKSNDLLRDAQANFKTFVSYVLYQQPQEIPSFLPTNWPGLKLPGNTGGNAAGQEDP